ncbi:nuclear transport factor 2 family protein [Rhodococcus spongiicola]|uniref:Nuclear transport factor 2 family protein n=1 Tax=Rhodococcus spongiicola TaxID=2487352 RepID=A0A438B6I9_9NOCA|nr:nuclear transport factor 2 family protein [Rhodococcus spongiicola]RVW06539.1 nuclear transport factor 2 family protein [Rhodococcus spongiicola]
MSISEIATVLAWHDALNDSDVETLLMVSSDDIELADSEGAAQGLAALREWAASAGISLVPGRMFQHDGVIVVEEQATWESKPGESRTVGTAFRVVNDQVTAVFRHETLEAALEATELTDKDLVTDL